MRLLVFNWRDITHPSRGGAEVYTHEVLRRFVADGHTVTLFSAKTRNQARTETIDGVHHVRAGGRLGVYRAARAWYRSVGSDEGYDVVIDQINTRPFNCQAWVDDAPVVGFAHQIAKEVWFAEFPLPVAMAGRYVLEPRWLKQLRHLPTLTVSPSSRQSLLDAGLQKVAIVPEGVDQPFQLGVLKEETPTAIFVGRLAANKRPDHAVQAVGLARRVIPDLQIWVVGEGPLADRLQDLDGVTLFGRVSQIEKLSLMGRAHVLLTTSVREGWGLVVDEAASVGTLAIGYDVPGLRDSVGATAGFLVQPRPEAMADELIRRLPGIVLAGARAPATPLASGAVSWDQVAEVFMQKLTQIVELDQVRAPSKAGLLAHQDLLTHQPQPERQPQPGRVLQ